MLYPSLVACVYCCFTQSVMLSTQQLLLQQVERVENLICGSHLSRHRLWYHRQHIGNYEHVTPTASTPGCSLLLASTPASSSFLQQIFHKTAPSPSVSLVSPPYPLLALLTLCSSSSFLLYILKYCTLTQCLPCLYSYPIFNCLSSTHCFRFFFANCFLGHIIHTCTSVLIHTQHFYTHSSFHQWQICCVSKAGSQQASKCLPPNSDCKTEACPSCTSHHIQVSQTSCNQQGTDLGYETCPRILLWGRPNGTVHSDGVQWVSWTTLCRTLHT